MQDYGGKSIISFNILSNAINYTNSGGKIEIRVVARRNTENTDIDLSITDNGIGIADKDIV